MDRRKMLCRLDERAFELFSRYCGFANYVSSISAFDLSEALAAVDNL